MVDLISNRTIDLTKLALDGLTMRQKAVSSNIANVMTPGYQRKDVQFEDQLQEMIDKDNVNQGIKIQNSMQYNPQTLDEISYNANSSGQNSGCSPKPVQYLQSDIYGKFNPQVADDNLSGSDSTGNNVNIETEAMNMTQTGLRYNVLATLEQKQLGIIKSAVKGDAS